MLTDFARDTDVDRFLLAGRYTLLEQGALEIFPLCQQKQIGLVLGGVYNSGILASGARTGALYNYAPAPPDMLQRVGRIELFAGGMGYRCMWRRSNFHWRIRQSHLSSWELEQLPRCRQIPPRLIGPSQPICGPS